MVRSAHCRWCFVLALLGAILTSPQLVARAGEVEDEWVQEEKIFGTSPETPVERILRLQRERASTVPVVPSNAHRTPLGTWACDRGYRWSGSQCERVAIPENASLSIFGNGWTCNRGFYQHENGCARVVIPENAGLNMFGNGWACNRGFYQYEAGCARVVVPENASLNMFGNGWACNPGYQAAGNQCVRIVVPPNAQIGLFGNGWVCNPGFLRRGKACVQIPAGSAPVFVTPQIPALIWVGRGGGGDYDVSGTSDSGDYVTGTVEKAGDGEVEGYLDLEDGSTVYFEGVWDGPGEIEGYDDDGNYYDLEVD